MSFNRAENRKIKLKQYWMLLLKLYLPIFLIIALFLAILFLLGNPTIKAVRIGDIPFIKDNEGLAEWMEQSKWIFNLIAISISIAFLFGIRIFNAKRPFNKGNLYLDIKYYHLKVARIMGYNNFSLARVPIDLHYKVILNETFKNIIAEEHDTKEKSTESKTLNDKNESNEVNLVLSDTYKVELEQIPERNQSLPTVCIDSKNTKRGIRIYNPKFVEEVQKAVSEMPKKYKRVNVFSHTNTQHNKEIIEKGFLKGGRGEFQTIYVYRYDTSNEKFNDLGVKVK